MEVCRVKHVPRKIQQLADEPSVRCTKLNIRSTMQIRVSRKIPQLAIKKSKSKLLQTSDYPRGRIVMGVNHPVGLFRLSGLILRDILQFEEFVFPIDI